MTFSCSTNPALAPSLTGASPRGNVGAMRTVRPGLTLTLVVIVVLVSGIPLSHAHDTSAPGLYNAQCALLDLAGHAAAPPLSAPAPLRLDVTPVRLALVADGPVVDVGSDPASPRAPPQQ